MPAVRLLRRNVIGRTHKFIDRRDRWGILTPCHTKIGDLHHTCVIDEYILWLNVAMYYVLFVSNIESFSDLPGVVQCSQLLYPPAGRNMVPDSLSIYIFHHDLLYITIIPPSDDPPTAPTTLPLKAS